MTTNTHPDPKDTLQIWKLRYAPIVTKRQVEQITKKATLWQRVRLLSHPSHYSIDGKAVIRYKEMDGMTFVMKRGTKL